MGTKINMVAVAIPWFRFSSRGSIFLSAKAAIQCVREAVINPDDIGLLINTGIYRYKNTGEPAIAAVIQKKIGANSKTTFSFDLNNGGCGWLTGIQLIDGMLQSGEILYGMVVTGDSEPFRGLSKKFNFEPAAAAIILSKSEGFSGFSLFRTYSFPQFAEELISNTNYGQLQWKLGKRNILSVRQKETYTNRCIDCTLESMTEFLSEAGLPLNETDLIITSQSPEGFVSGMKERTGMNDKFIEIAKTGNREIHTAGPVFALKKAWDDHRFIKSKNILFVTVGAGINVAFALYRN